ncbi:hypothetical protein BD324DRAFT_583229 [Kockovaella imperatae]|uniref:tRNA-splicing endonuclease subunit Sen54 N-terminal domain-containing protein n=1 Tax=Kockovaella imperatae TaxID=4999 RepID=A0A1Y1U9R0_9TREE|nr:hypothetical protein BD324DRAFT_583229 [Kockovaella imperatae]ORX34768.1 hypothetical protein BD324DRAFT_583229 [Kockovaella imperatae]
MSASTTHAQSSSRDPEPNRQSSINSGLEVDDDEDDVLLDLSRLQSFASRVQYVAAEENQAGPSSIRPKMTIPKRGEKDFEPLEETVNLQDMMLQRSREALFSALLGVRGGNIQSISQAIILPSSPYPRILTTRGHLMDSMGISISGPAVKPQKRRQTHTELLPEEALYLLERGSLQIWIPNTAKVNGGSTPSNVDWNDTDFGFEDCIEMSVMQGFSFFLGKDGLTWERYQAYAYLKRLGYTVQRSRRFLPTRFLGGTSESAAQLPLSNPGLPPFRSWWLSIPVVLRRCFGALGTVISRLLWHRSWSRRQVLERSALQGWSGRTYSSIGLHLHCSQSGLSTWGRARMTRIAPSDRMTNPYTPFWHVWKPDRPWSKAQWDKSSAAGLARQPFDFAVAAVDARAEPLPSLEQLDEIFDSLPQETDTRPRPVVDGVTAVTTTAQAPPQPNRPSPKGRSVPSIRNGDRAFVVAVNDSGNQGWVRFGRTGFASIFDV